MRQGSGLRGAGPPAGPHCNLPPRAPPATCQRRCGLNTASAGSRPQGAGRGRAGRARCAAAGPDPDTYTLEYDSDDEHDALIQDLVQEDCQSSAGVRGPVLPRGATLPEKAEFGLRSLAHTLASAPRDVWRSVSVTAGAAGVLTVSAAAQGVRGLLGGSDEPDWGPQPSSSQPAAAAAASPAAATSASAGAAPAQAQVRRARERWQEAKSEMPEGTWGKIQWFWDRPALKKLRITISMAQWSVRLPALAALLATQMGLIASQVSLPMLAPLLLGTGMMLRSIRSNASLIFPRICVLVVLLYLLWFANSVVQNTVVYLRRQGAVDARVSGAIITASECCALLAALVIVLSMLGVNVSGLLLPAGIALAYAAKDLSHNFLAGFFLFVVQPFRLGDRISVSYSTPAAASSAARSAWFEGTCEKVDLRYTIVKSGSRRLFVPNSAFLTREFVVLDDSDGPKSPEKRDLFPAEQQQQQQQQAVLQQAAQRPVWAQGPVFLQQQQQQQPWMRPPGDGGAGQLGEPGPSQEQGQEAWYGPPQQPGYPLQQQQAQAPQQMQPPPQQQQPGAEPQQQNGNVLEWQRRQSGAHRGQLAPDPQQWPRRA